MCVSPREYGILLHQILQWHHMVSSIISATTMRGLKINTLGDGLFHAATWVFAVIGLAVLWRTLSGACRVWSTRVFAGWLLAGWGGFNLVEGIIDHQVLGVHHVRPGPHQLAYDLGFLALGAFLVWIGRILAASHRT